MANQPFDQYLDHLKQFLRIESIKSEPTSDAPYGQAIKEAHTFLMDLARSFGFKVSHLDHKVAIVDYDEVERDDYIGIFTHLDVVNVDDAEDWIAPPFSGEIIDGRMYGRGTLDDKGPALAVLFAMKSLKDQGFKPKKGIRLVVGGDEESGMECLKSYKEKMPAPLFGFTPDALFPVTIKEKGIITAEVEFPYDENSVIHSIKIGQSTNVKPTSGTYRIRKSNGAGNLLKFADIQVNELNDSLEVYVAPTSQEAIASAVNQLLELCENEAVTSKSLSLISSVFLDETGNALGIGGSNNDDLLMRATKLHTESNTMVLTLDIRYPTEQNESEMKALLTNRVNELGLTSRIIQAKPPVNFDEDHPMVSQLIRVYKSVTGRNDQPQSMAGGTYARIYPDRVIAFGALLPDEPVTAHQKNEHVKLELMELWLEIYERAIRELSQ